MKFTYLGNYFNCESYGTVKGKFSFSITHNELGWSATYKDVEFEGKQVTQYILNGTESSLQNPFKTRTQAETACRKKLKELKH